MHFKARYAKPVINLLVPDTLKSIRALGSVTRGTNSPANSTSFNGPLGVTSKVEGANLTSLNSQLITYSIPAVIIEMPEARGGNALRLDIEKHLASKSYLLYLQLCFHRDVIMIRTQSDHRVSQSPFLSWTTSALDTAAYAFSREAAELLNVSYPFVCINHANKEQDVFDGYGKGNQRKLMKIQQDTDPRGIFTSTGLRTCFFKIRGDCLRGRKRDSFWPSTIELLSGS
ncbi:Uncharacterized protein HZ326_23998 [Fusarium oxysporum f. sp. albedinis]|nr:Uncharacterized protein HZ326_23998 [Fusarium oxysporum f. sp. albedinis]